MVVSIPVEKYTPPSFRVLIRETFGADDELSPTKSATDWTVLSEYDPSDPYEAGYELLYIRGRTLPDIGTAAFRIVYGRTSLDNSTPATVVPSYKRYEVRLQLKDYYAEDTEYATKFVGFVDYEEDEPYPGKEEELVTRIYYVVDTLTRTQKWPMNRHGYDPDLGNSEVPAITDCYGNPGYNYMPAADGPVMGNRSDKTYSPFGFSLDVAYCHVWMGANTLDVSTPEYLYWTDRESMEHALTATRPSGEPLFRFINTGAENYDIVNPWPVADNETVWGYLTRVGNRRRGFGSIATGWTDNVDGSITVFMVVCPNFYENEEQEYPIGSMDIISIVGAQTAGTVYTNPHPPGGGDANTWDLEGDQRIVDSGCQFSDAEMNIYDYIETVGERIELATTVSLADTLDSDSDISAIYDPDKQVSLAPRWNQDDVEDMKSRAQSETVMAKYDHIYQEFSMPSRWDYTVGTQLSEGKVQSIAFQVSDKGEIFQPTIGQPNFASPCHAEILGYLPLYSGYLYDGSVPKRTSNTKETSLPPRRSAIMYFRNGLTTDDRWFLPLGSFPENLIDPFQIPPSLLNHQPTMEIHPDGIYIRSQYYMDFGIRIFGDPDTDNDPAPGLGSVYPITQIAFTIGIKLPFRVRFCDTNPSTGSGFPLHPDTASSMADWRYARRKKTIYVPSAHLWLISSNCIWDLDQTDLDENGYAAQRNALGGDTDTPGVARDDRPRLLRYHMICRAWYLNPRRRAKVKMKFCHLLPYTVEGSMTPGMAPQLNEYIKDIAYNGKISPIGTPVSFADYDHQEGTSELATDWYEILTSV